MAYTQITTLLHAFSPMNSEPTRNKCVLPETAAPHEPIPLPRVLVMVAIGTFVNPFEGVVELWHDNLTIWYLILLTY